MHVRDIKISFDSPSVYGLMNWNILQLDQIYLSPPPQGRGEAFEKNKNKDDQRPVLKC